MIVENTEIKHTEIENPAKIVQNQFLFETRICSTVLYN